MTPTLLPPIQSLLLQDPISTHESDPETSSQAASRSLLSLDCSDDLRSYSRNLGPNARDTLSPSPFQERQQHVPTIGTLRCRPSIPSLTQINSTTLSAEPTPTLTPTRMVTLNLYSPTPRPPPPQFLTQSPLIKNIPLAMASQADGHDISEYPAGLRAALEECTASYTDTEPKDTIYHVIDDTKSTYMENSYHVEGTYKSLRAANLEAAKYFIDQVFCGALDEDEADFEVLSGSRLRCAVETDGSTGGYTEVYVLKAKLK